ncbi:MAG: IgGFc-binding protein, partial [Myxococcales bacterium]|nr:IgGFc-binding protein [Myxococcales bacterium]
AIVAAEDNTDVDVRLVGGATVLPDRDGRVRAAGGHVANRLAAQEVMLVHSAPSPNIFTVTDLSGAQVTANKPISVFAVHVCTNYPQDQAACDHLQEQLLPVDTWGNSFQLVPPATRARNAPREVIYWKIIGTNADANITLSVPFNQLQPMAPGAAGVPDCRNFLNGQDTIRLRPDQFCEFGTKRAVQLVSDTPIMVAGFIVGQEATGLLDFGSHAGDPAMFIVPPDRQYRRSYGFLTPDTYFSDYVTVTYLPGNELLLDGQPIDLADGIQVPGSNYFYKHVPVDDGPHLIEGRSLFGIMVYAYDDFVSYAFTGGLNLTKQ